MGRPPEQPPGNGDEHPPASNGDDDQPATAAPPADDVAAVLRGVVGAGIDHATTADLGGLFGLRSVRDRARDTSDDALTGAARDVIRDALDSLGDGNYGKAARMLFGATDDTRGQPARERRRLAAYQIDVMPDWFRRRYVPQITQDVAAEVLTIEHATTATPDGEAPEASTSDPSSEVIRIADATAFRASTDAAPTQVDQRPRWRRLLRRRQRPGTDSTAPVALTRGPHATSDTEARSRQLLRVLQALGDEQTRRQRRLVFLIVGIVAWVRYGTDAIPRYVLVLAVVGLTIAATGTLAEWRATRSLPLRQHWPRLFLLACTVLIAGGFVLDQNNNSDDDATDNAEALDCTLGSDCEEHTDEETTTTDPLGVRVTYTEPQEPTNPECPPEDGMGLPRSGGHGVVTDQAARVAA